MKNILVVILAAMSFACTVAAVGTTEPAIVEAANGKYQTAVFAGGCFWGVEAVFEHVRGVTDVKSGYAGGKKENATYDAVSGGDTGHAEAVIVTFDPAKVSYIQLLTVFFSVAHDPTELNKQGPDHGTQYRSAVFFTDQNQKKLAEAYIEAVNKSKAFPQPIVTEVSPLTNFYPAETYHQDYMKKNPDERYIVVNDRPKVNALKVKFPDLYVEK